MGKRRINPMDGMAAVRAVKAGEAARETHDATFALAVRFLLEALSDLRPGNTVEVRVPPLGATQCIEGPTHRRGTPPNVVEMDAFTWFDLAVGAIDWADATASGRLRASGNRADISDCLPLVAR
ncbi:MAG: sterol carrier family protein [Microbacteriaceae bacterium]